MFCQVARVSLERPPPCLSLPRCRTVLSLPAFAIYVRDSPGSSCPPGFTHFMFLCPTRSPCQRGGAGDPSPGGLCSEKIC